MVTPPQGAFLPQEGGLLASSEALAMQGFGETGLKVSEM